MYFLPSDCLSSQDSVRCRHPRKIRLPLFKCSVTISARLPKALMLNHRVCSCPYCGTGNRSRQNGSNNGSAKTRVKPEGTTAQSQSGSELDQRIAALEETVAI